MGGDSGPESTQVQGRGVTWEGLAWQQGSRAPGGCVSHLSGEEEAQETEWPHGGGVGGRCWSQLAPSLPLELHLLIQLIARLFSSLIFRGSVQFSSVQSLSHVQLLATPWMAARQACLSITSSPSLLKLMSIESVMPSNHLILCRPLLFPPSIFPSIGVFSNESALRIRWPKDWIIHPEKLRPCLSPYFLSVSLSHFSKVIHQH